MRPLVLWEELRSWAFAGSVGFLVLAACGRPMPPPAQPAPLPAYTPEDSALFNDVFRPELFGTPGAQPAELDPLFDERVARATSVVPAKVVTLTREGSEGLRRYTVVVESTAEALAGEALSRPITLNVSATSPMFATFVGTRLLLFVREFADGPHFHGAEDTESTRAAIARAKVTRRPPK